MRIVTHDTASSLVKSWGEMGFDMLVHLCLHQPVWCIGRLDVGSWEEGVLALIYTGLS